MAIGKIYRSDPKEYEIIKDFAHQYRLENIEQKVKLIREAPGYLHSDPYRYDSYDYLSIKETHMTYFSFEISERDLINAVNKLHEFEELAQDPETAKLLMEARFINRLKRGRY